MGRAAALLLRKASGLPMPPTLTASDPCHQCHRNGNHLRAPGRGGAFGGGDRLTLTQLSQQRSTTSGECSFDLELGASATKVNQRLQDRYNKLTRVAAGW